MTNSSTIIVVGLVIALACVVAYLLAPKGENQTFVARGARRRRVEDADGCTVYGALRWSLRWCQCISCGVRCAPKPPVRR